MIKIAVYSAHSFEKPYLAASNKGQFELMFIDEPLTRENVNRAQGCKVVALFTSDDASADILKCLKEQGTGYIVTRSVGYDHIDIGKAAELDLKVANVPRYSPHAIAEHAVALMLALSRHLALSDKKIKKNDFSIEELTGFNLRGKTAGIIGTGKIGEVVCKILHGFGCRLLAYDIIENASLIKDYGLKYVNKETLCAESDIITLHTPLTPHTTYIIDQPAISLMKKGVMLINTSRGKLINTKEVLMALQSGKIGFLGIDVYENEKGLFFYNHSQKGIDDEMLKELIKLDNVVISAHHAFLTKEALTNIADTTMKNIEEFVYGRANPNLISPNKS